MAATRPLVLGLVASASSARSGILGLPLLARSVARGRRSIYLSPRRATPTLATSTPSSSSSSSNAGPAIRITHKEVQVEVADARHAAFLGEADSNDGHDLHQHAYGAPLVALDARHAAFLGEADSDDGFEARKVAEGERQEALDARHAAFLGEADSDDGFEARKVAEGERQEALDARHAAFLGEADSDDAFEAHVEVYPDKHTHRIDDTTPSGFHGERGEMDSNERVA